MTNVRRAFETLAAAAALLLAAGCQRNDLPAAAGAAAAAPSVKVVAPQRTTLRRTVTQPATVHAYHRAEIYAKAAGYLRELDVDIGQAVESGAVLAVIDVPEMLKSQQRQQATIARLRADEGRAAAGVTVAQALVRAAQATLEQSRADIRKADAQLAADQSELARVTELVQSKAVSDRLLDEARKRFESSEATKTASEAAVVSAEANVAVSEAKLVAAEADLATALALTNVAQKELEEIETLTDYATLRAPFDGVVIERHVDRGDLVRNIQTSSGRDGAPLFVVAQLDKVRVRVPVPENDAPWVDVGDPATLVLRSMPGRPFKGRVDRLSEMLDESTRTMQVEIDLPNPDRKLRPGMYGEVTVVLEEHADCLVLPAGAVRHDEAGRSYVYVVSSDNIVKSIDVKTGMDDGRQIEIVAGLSGIEQVVGAMIGRLHEGQVVRIDQK